MEAVGTSAWTPSHSAVLTKETTSPYEGTQCLRVAYGGAVYPQAIQACFPNPGIYRVSGYVRSDGTSLPSVLSSLGTNLHWTGTASTSWTPFDICGYVGAGESLILRAAISAAGYVEFDQVSVQAVSIENKVIACQSDGLLYTESLQAYGTWEFALRKSSGSNAFVGFMLDGVAGYLDTGIYGYWLGFDYRDRVMLYLSRGTGATLLCNSADDYISSDTWYRLKVTRRYDGTFTLYIKGGSFGDAWTLVNVAGGTNPITNTTATTSKYMVLDLDSYDRVGDFKVYCGVI